MNPLDRAEDNFQNSLPQEEKEQDVCDHCFKETNTDNLCEVPMDGTSNYSLYVCPDCYDEVCDEEGFNPQENIPKRP